MVLMHLLTLMCLTEIARHLKSFSQNKKAPPIYINFMGMEDETREFLVRILNTVAIVLIWMIANVFIGIYKGFAFFESQPDWKNYIYYVFLLASFIFLIIHLKRKWKL